MVKRVDRSGDFATAAYELFSRKGLDQVKMDDIAAHCGATKGSLYWHYKSKDEVIESACRHYYREWHRVSERNVLNVSDPLEKIRVTVQNSVKSCLIDVANRIFTMEILTRSLYDHPTREGWKEFFDSVFDFYLALVDDAIKAGALKVDDPEKAVGLMLSAMEGYKMRAVFEPELCIASRSKVITGELLGLLGLPTD